MIHLSKIYFYLGSSTSSQILFYNHLSNKQQILFNLNWAQFSFKKSVNLYMHQRSRSGQVEFTILSIQNSSFRSQKEKLSKQKRLRQIQIHLLIVWYLIIPTSHLFFTYNYDNMLSKYIKLVIRTNIFIYVRFIFLFYSRDNLQNYKNLNFSFKFNNAKYLSKNNVEGNVQHHLRR